MNQSIATLIGPFCRSVLLPELDMFHRLVKARSKISKGTARSNPYLRCGHTGDIRPQEHYSLGAA
jgi:hypothetical protein